MKAIALSGKRGKGKFVIVDDVDFDLSKWKWTLTNSGYVKRNLTIRNRGHKTKYKAILMHRIIGERMGLDVSQEVDHRNRNRLDCQRHNLRPATHTQNCNNMGPKKNSTTRLKGVYFHRQRGKFAAAIRANGKRTYLGLFETAEAAYAAYCEMAKKHHGEFCCV